MVELGRLNRDDNGSINLGALDVECSIRIEDWGLEPYSEVTD